MDLGWLGLGAMGLPMASRVAVRHRVRAYDPTGSRGDRIGAGARSVASPAEAARGCDALCLAVATPDQAQEALFGPDGAAGELRPGCRLVLLSTLGVRWVREATSRLPDVAVVDAPVSGGVTRAAEGTLLVMAAHADQEVLDLLALLGEVVVVGEEPGQGQAMKMVNQVLCGVHIAAAAEALALAEAIGFDPAVAWDVVRRGAGASFMLDDRGARMVSGQPDPVRSAVSLFVKDLALVLEEGSRAGQPTPLTAAAADLFDRAAASGRRAHDDSELFELLRSLRAPAPG